MQTVFGGDNLCEKLKPVLWEKIRKKVMHLTSAELAQSVIKAQLDKETLT